MVEVENGLVHGLEYDPEKGKYTNKDLKDANESPEKILEACENHSYDFEYENFSSKAISATKVGIDAVNGVIDVFEGENLVDRYSLVGVLENEEGQTELVFSGFDHGENEVVAKSSSEIEWSPNLAAAYEALYQSMDFEKDRERETVSLYGDDENERGSEVTTIDDISAREVVKRIDDFIGDIKDPASGISDFEDKGEIKVEGDEHYGKARGFKAAMELKTDMNRLRSEGLHDYKIQPLDDNGDEKEVDFRIERQFLDGNDSLKSGVHGLSDFDVDTHKGRKELTENRM
jgi:hypothetical protein